MTVITRLTGFKILAANQKISTFAGAGKRCEVTPKSLSSLQISTWETPSQWQGGKRETGSKCDATNEETADSDSRVGGFYFADKLIS